MKIHNFGLVMTQKNYHCVKGTGEDFSLNEVHERKKCNMVSVG